MWALQSVGHRLIESEARRSVFYPVGRVQIQKSPSAELGKNTRIRQNPRLGMIDGGRSRDIASALLSCGSAPSQKTTSPVTSTLTKFPLWGVEAYLKRRTGASSCAIGLHSVTCGKGDIETRARVDWRHACITCAFFYRRRVLYRQNRSKLTTSSSFGSILWPETVPLALLTVNISRVACSTEVIPERTK